MWDKSSVQNTETLPGKVLEKKHTVTPNFVAIFVFFSTASSFIERISFSEIYVQLYIHIYIYIYYLDYI